MPTSQRCKFSISRKIYIGLWKTKLNVNKSQVKIEPEDTVISLNYLEKKCNNNNGKFSKGE